MVALSSFTRMFRFTVSTTSRACHAKFIETPKACAYGLARRVHRRKAAVDLQRHDEIMNGRAAYGLRSKRTQIINATALEGAHASSCSIEARGNRRLPLEHSAPIHGFSRRAIVLKARSPLIPRKSLSGSAKRHPPNGGCPDLLDGRRLPLRRRRATT